MASSPRGVERSQHSLTESEWKPLFQWVHSHPCKGNNGLGEITLQFSQTGLGVATEVICSCGEKFDATDYNLW